MAGQLPDAQAIRITLPDGSSLSVPRGTTPAQVAEQIGPRLAKDALAAKVNGRLIGLNEPLHADAQLTILTFADPEGREVMRHSAAHVMAHAVCELFPGARLAIGPALEDRFYYDFDLPRPLTPDDLQAIEQRMAEIVDRNLPIVREVLSRDEALELFRKLDQKYKVEIINELPDDEPVTIYRQGEFVDLCRGPHLPSTGRVGKVFKLLSIAGAYWRGDESREQLQRIYGTCFETKAQLEEFQERLAEAERRDHRKLGPQLDLFMFFPEAGPGLPFYPPNGAMLKRIIEQWLTDLHLKRGYQLVWTPHLIRSELWHISGHYQTGYPMYFTEIEGQEYGVKPMNCPGHILIYKSHTRSYRDLPIRYFELGTVYRHERAGVLHGLLRVRGFTQDDAHIFCTPDQLVSEICGVIEFGQEMLRVFGFEEFRYVLSTKPEKAVGDDALWERATDALRQALEQFGLDYDVEEGGGAHYGPKIDLKLKDALGREWQGSTIQCDLNLPERFDLTYIGEDGKEHRPAMIHRVVLAGIERWIGILIEHYGGAFPLWLAPVQIVLLPIADRHNEYARAVAQKLRENGFRVEVDERSERISYKVREAELQKIPVMLIVGDREVSSEQVSVRRLKRGDLGPCPVQELISTLRQELAGGEAG